MRRFLLFSFYLLLSFEAKADLGTVVEKMLGEDRSLAEKIMFDTIFRQILERSLLVEKLVGRSILLKKLAGEKSKEEFEDTWKSEGELEDTWKSRNKLEDTWKLRGELEDTQRKTVRSKSLLGKDLVCKDEKGDLATWGTSVMTTVPDLVPSLVKTLEKEKEGTLEEEKEKTLEDVKEETLEEGDRVKMGRGQSFAKLPWLGGKGVRIM